MPKYLSGRSKVTPQSKLQSDRYRYLSIENAEPNLGDPLVGLSSVTAKPVPPGQQFIVVSVEGDEPGQRYWIPSQGGIIPGSISVFDDNTLVGALSSITQLNFVGAAITASVSIASSNLATIRVFSPGNNQEIIFNTANEFSTSTKLKFDPSIGLLIAGDRIIVGAGGTVITTTGIGSVGIGTTDPTQELHLQGDLRLTGTIYDSNNEPGTNTQLLVKNNFGGLTWINQGTVRSGAGGTYTNIQFHNSAGLVDGATNFVFDDINNRVGIGSTQPKVLLDVLGISSFKGGTTIDNLNVTGTTTTQNLRVTGVSTIGFVTGTSAFFTGIVTATKFVGELNVSQLYVTGVSTFLQKVNINSDLGITGITTTQNLQVYQSTTLNRLNATGLSTFTTVDINGGEIDVNRIGTQNLNVSGIGTFSSQVNINNLSVTGVGTFDNIKIYDNNIETTIGNLILDSSAGTTQINDAVYVNDITQSTSKDTGSIITEGGVGIEKDLYVGGPVNLATSGGITTTGGDLYVRGDLYVSNDIFYDELFARNGYFTGITSTKDLNVTGIATIATLGISGLTTTRNLRVIGVGTFDGLLDANAGATIDNIQIGISGDNEIDTSTGNLILDSFGGTVEITDQLIVSGVSTFSNNVVFNGNVTLGDLNTDTVTFTSRINSIVLPSTNGTLDLGGPSNRWSTIYATTFNGAFVGNADSASQVSTGTTTGTTTYFPTFVDSNNVTRSNEFLYTDAGISYNPSTDLLTAGNLGVSGLTTTRNLIVSGISTFNELLDANAGATIDNIQIGISGDNEIDTSTGNLTIDSAGGTTTIDDNVSITGNLTVSGISTFNGNVTIGDANTDKVSFGATVDSNIIPSGTTRDLGSVQNKWNNIYANNFVGTIIGNADTATKLATPREIDISGDVIGVGIGTTFDGSQNVTIPTVLSTTGVSSATYGSATTVPQIAVDAKGRITSASNVNIDFSKASYADNAGISTNLKGGIASQIPYQSAANTTTFIPNGTLGQLLQSNGTSAPSWVTATDLTVSKASYADNAGISTNLKGGIASQIPYQTAANTTAFIPNGTLGQLLQSNGTSAPSWVTATDLTVSKASYADNAGISTNLKGGTTGSIPYQTAANTTTFLADPNVNGRILTWNDITNAPIWSDPTAISVGTASSLNVTTDTSSSPRYLVLSSTTSGITTALVDSDITYTPSTDLLTVSKIKPTQIQDTGGGTGTANYVLTANGSGGWSWSSVTGGGSPAIGGITIQEEGSTVGTQLGITTVNFVGASVTATSPSAGTANITVTAASNVTVTQTGYGCTNPISVTGGSNIGIGSTSNAYGRRFIQTVEPTGVCDGDIWYDISGGTTGDNTPAGTVIYYAASSAPTGYLKANGASLSTTTYATLFAAIGYTFGGSGASFNVPDLRNKFAVGSESLYALAATGGSADATLVSHSHTGTTANKNVTGTFNAWDRYSTFPPTGAFSYNGQNYNPQFAGGGGEANCRGFTMNITHNHDFTTSTEGVSATNANLPPYLALLACIKY
jgi:microcystin-dependent protein